jgi:MYXO-CTERM domain-containing protein
MSHDEAKRKVLARRARFMAVAGIAGVALSASTPARADDASADDAGDDGSVLVEAGGRPDGGEIDADGAPPTPCLTMKRPDDPQPCLSSCAATPNASGASIAPAIVVAGAAIAGLRRRRKKKQDAR